MLFWNTNYWSGGGGGDDGSKFIDGTHMRQISGENMAESPLHFACIHSQPTEDEQCKKENQNDDEMKCPSSIIPACYRMLPLAKHDHTNKYLGVCYHHILGWPLPVCPS